MDPIISLDDENNAAIKCKANYNLIRDLVQESREWTFATRRISLTPLATAPVYGYPYQFLLHPDVLRVLNVPANVASNTVSIGGGSSDFLPEVEYWTVESITEGRVILASSSAIFARVLWRIRNEGLFPPSFVHAFAARLAAEIAMPLTEDRQLQVDMQQLYAAKIHEAAAIDGMQGRSKIVRSTHLTRVR